MAGRKNPPNIDVSATRTLSHPNNLSRVFVARLAGTTVFDPIGDSVGRVRDVVVLVRATGAPLVVGLVIEIPGRRRVFMPITRVISIDTGHVISTGLVNLRRFEQRPMESLVIGELLERRVTLKDGTGDATVEDVAIVQQRNGDWLVEQAYVRRHAAGKTSLGLRRRGSTLTVDINDVTGLAISGTSQGAALLLEAYSGMRTADLADALHELSDARRLEVAKELDIEHLADVLEELPEDDQVGILSGLEIDRAADVLEAMQPDDAADLLHDLPDAQAKELLELMEPDEAEDVRRLLIYDEDTAGGLMITEPIILSPETSIGTALAQIRKQDLTPALASVVFVARPPLETPTGRFLGVAHFQRLLRQPPHAAVGTALDSDDVVWLSPDTSLDHITRLFAAYDLLALPVLDDERRLLGVVCVDDVLDHILPDDWRETDLEPHPAEITGHEIVAQAATKAAGGGGKAGQGASEGDKTRSEVSNG